MKLCRSQQPVNKKLNYLLLTRTWAGVDALRLRLKSKGIIPKRYHLDTIAAWALRYASSFRNPLAFRQSSHLVATSGLQSTKPHISSSPQAALT